MSRHKKTQDYEISALLDEDPTALGDRKVYDLEDPNFRAESAKYRVTQYPEDFCCKYTAAGEEVLFCIFCVKIINTKSSRVSEHVKSIKHLENKGENDPYFTINQAFNSSILTPDPNEDDSIAQEEFDTTGPGYVNTKDPYQIVNLFPDDVILAIQGPNDSDRAFCKFCNEFQITSSSAAVSHLSTKKHFESKNKQMKLVSQIKPFQPAKTKVLKQASPPPKKPRPFILHRSADGPQLPRPKHSAGGLVDRPKPETSESRPAEPCDEDYYKIRGTCARLCDLPVTQAQTGVHDVEIVCADGRLFSHKALVCHYSTLLRQHQRDTWASRELLTIFIPQVNVYIVRKLLEFLQNRPVKLKRDEVKHFRQVYTLLQIDLVPVEKLDFKPLGVGKSVSSKRKTPPPTTMNKTSKKQRLLVENIKQEAISVEDIQDPLLATNPNQLRRILDHSGDVDERGDLNGEVTAQEYGQPRALQHDEDEHAQQDEFMEEGNADQDELLEGGNADQDELQEEEDHPEPDELQEEEDAEQNELLEVDHEEGNENQIEEEEEDARPQNGWEAAIQAELKGTSVDHLSDEAENIVSCEDDAMSEDESEDDFTVEYLEGGDGGS